MQKFKGKVEGFKVEAVDTTGAGDAFVSGVLYNLASDINLYQVSQVSRNGWVSYISQFFSC